MLNNIFLLYANNSLIKDPKSLFIIFADILNPANLEKPTFKIYEKPGPIEYARALLELMVLYTGMDDEEAACEHQKELKNKAEEPVNSWEDYEEDIRVKSSVCEIALEAVYGYRHGYCDEMCEGRAINLEKMAELANLQIPQKLKCFQCNQLFFITYLSALYNGKSLKDICETSIDEIGKCYKKYGAPSFDSLFLKPAFYCIKSDFVINEKGKLKEKKLVTLDNLIGYNSCFQKKSRVIDFINSVIGYSIGEYLTKKSTRNIRRCRVCGEFFDDYASRHLCRPPKSCEEIYDREYHKKDMRKRRDPHSDKFDPKYIT